MEELNKPILVISAINIFEGGPLTVLKECLDSLNTVYHEEYRIYAFVHKEDMFNCYNNIHFIELPKSRKSWFYRLYYEYSYFKKISKEWNPYLWLSLHDTSPVLKNTTKQCVYCHNPSIFYKTGFSEIKYDKKHVLFSLFYKFLYQINQKSNRFIIVQQDWIRKKFNELYNFPLSNIVVSYPGNQKLESRQISNKEKFNNEYKTFIYPAFPRVFKNYEIIVKAAKILLDWGIYNFQIKFTIDGSENNYAKEIKELGKNIDQIGLIGLMPHEVILKEYGNTDVLIFPSKLETWGLPITEFKNLEKPILASDLPYARETVGNYNQVGFFNPDNATDLAAKMKAIIEGKAESVLKPSVIPQPASPFTTSWTEMLGFILNN